MIEKSVSNLHKLGVRSLPTNFGPLKGANANARITGPCGDTMEIWLGIGGAKIVQAAFATDGCHSSILAGSMTAWLAEERTLEEARRLSQAEVLKAVGNGVEPHCALLAVNTLHAALDAHLRQESRAGAPCSAAPSPESAAGAAPAPPQAQEEAALRARLQSIRQKLVVLSGKGGVGKSTVAANLALSLAMSGQRVGLLDVDIHGPSIPKLMGLEGERPDLDGDTIQPLRVSPNLKVMSIGFLLGGKRDAVIWRGPMKSGVIRQFLCDVAWGELDFLVIDSPPGTGDEPLSVAQLIGPGAAAVIVTTPQEVAVADVRRSVTFCERLSLPVLGVIENMSGFVCPHCRQTTDLFKSGGGEELAREMGVRFLGRVPLDPHVVISGDTGTPFVRRYADSPSALAFAQIVRALLEPAESCASAAPPAGAAAGPSKPQPEP